MRSLLRRAALLLPPIRHLYTFATEQSGLAAQLQIRVTELEARQRDLHSDLRSAEEAAAKLASLGDQVAALMAERDAALADVSNVRNALAVIDQNAREASRRAEQIDLQNYLLRSDLHRASERNEALSHALRAAEQVIR